MNRKLLIGGLVVFAVWWFFIRRKPTGTLADLRPDLQGPLPQA